MNRDYFEVVTLLAAGEYEQIGNLFQMYHSYSHKDYNSFVKAINTAVMYGLIQRKDRHFPLICNRTFLKITDTGYKFLDHYEIKYYKGTNEARFIDSDFLGI